MVPDMYIRPHDFTSALGFTLMGFCEVGMICLWLHGCGYTGARHGDGCTVRVFG